MIIIEFVYNIYIIYIMASIDIGYKKDDFLWNVYPDASCNTDENCIENKDLSSKLMNMQVSHNGSDERYNDSMDYYNRKLNDIFTLGVGIIAASYYIFRNYNSLKKTESKEQ
tara:strand:+ start:427 stop:762 length:336 start_codon:yes stop_codon:yes gene_type:complete